MTSLINQHFYSQTEKYDSFPIFSPLHLTLFWSGGKFTPPPPPVGFFAITLVFVADIAYILQLLQFIH